MKVSTATFLVCVLLNSAWSEAQEEKIETPSQKTKQAIDKFRNAPAEVRTKLEMLGDMAADKLGDIVGDRNLEPQPAANLSMPSKKSADQDDRPRYSPTGKRDPFRPFTLNSGASARRRESLTPLERYDLSQLKLVAVIWDIKEPRAMVEDAGGLGYVIKTGTAIGSSYGKVKAIRPDEVIVEEIYIDFYGVRKKREVNLKLSAK